MKKQEADAIARELDFISLCEKVNQKYNLGDDFVERMTKIYRSKGEERLKQIEKLNKIANGILIGIAGLAAIAILIAISKGK